jgi:prepilin-type N-terminal cleavage/methylation domain-containing protein/prepilin-type processing-associated H-X9-DG protein
MNRRRWKTKKPQPAFTLVEMLVVMGILGLLMGLALPSVSFAILKAQSAKCATNLRTIGTAVSLAATDNNGQYPAIDQAASSVYPAGSSATNLVGALGTYGISTANIQCPTDMNNGTNCAFTLYGSSYEWNPCYDDESTVTPILYFNAGVSVPVNSSRVRLCTDFLPIHNHKMNAVYGDGHVKAR